MEGHLFKESAAYMENPVPICHCHTQEAKNACDCDIQSRLSFDEDSKDIDNSATNLVTSKNKRKATIYIEMDKYVDATKSGKMSDFKVVVKPKSTADLMTHKVKKCTSKLSNICKKIMLFVLFSGYILFINAVSQKYILPYFSTQPEKVVLEELPTHGALAERLQSERAGSLADGGFHWASYYQDSDRFYKGIDRLPWMVEEDSGTGITLTNKDCFLIQKRSVYEVYSKVTFEYTRENTTKSAIYHNIHRVRNGELTLLDKSVLSMPYRPPKTGRIFQPSSIIVIGEFFEGDAICVNVHDSSLVLAAKRDNSVKIIQKGN